MNIRILGVIKDVDIIDVMKSSAMSQGIDYEQLKTTLAGAETDLELYRAIVNAPFSFKIETTLMSLGIIVLLLVDKKNGMIERIAISNNELAKRTKSRSAKKFEDIKIPISHPENIIAKAIETGTPQSTTDWQYLFVPELSPQDARFNQIEGGIGFSSVYPLIGARDGGALIFSYFQYPERIHTPQEDFMERYTSLVSERLAG